MQIPIKNKLNKDELFRIKRMKEVIKATRPHGHKDYLEIIYLEEGAGIHQIDHHRYPVKPHSLYLVMPGQIHSWELTEIPKGFVAMIQKDFLLDHPLYSLLFQTFPPPFPNGLLLDHAAGTYEGIFNSIQKEYVNGEANHKAIIQAYLQLLFNLLVREIKSEDAQAPSPLLQHFFQKLDSGFRENHEVKLYAETLSTTPRTLNTACKKFTGMTAGALINQKLTVEAKKLLLYSPQNLTEIAFELGFTDASHFNKFFKRQTGVLPSVYRKGIS